METLLSTSTGYILLISYGLFMFGLSYFYLKESKTHTNFLVADRKVGFMGTSAIVGNSIPVGVGFGLSSKIKKIT